jgi:hypothetical protein
MGKFMLRWLVTSAILFLLLGVIIVVGQWPDILFDGVSVREAATLAVSVIAKPSGLEFFGAISLFFGFFLALLLTPVP